jgi:hypothetical protein
MIRSGHATRPHHGYILRKHVLWMCAAIAACSCTRDVRFGDVRDVVVAEVLESNPVARPTHFRPPQVIIANPQGAHFFMAFIVDTTGHVEPQTVSFLGDAPVSFRAPLCAMLAGWQYEPVRRAGKRHRALVIRPFDFWPAHDSTHRPTANGGFDSTRAALVGHGVDAAVKHLETLPHC